MHHSTILRGWFCSLFGVCGLNAAVLGDYTIVDLGRGRANAISNGGAVVGWHDNRAVIWGSPGMSSQPVDLGTLGGTTSEAFDINDLNQVAGWAQTTGGLMHAFGWTQEEGMVDLAVSDTHESCAFGINSSGAVVGWMAGYSVAYSMAWDGSEPTPLGTLGGLTSEACAINDLGQIVGWAETDTGLQHPFLWTVADGMSDLEELSLDNGYAHGINNHDVNNDGFVVGWCAGRAVFWGSYWDGGEHTDLGDLGGGEGRAYAVNDSGQIVGYSMTAALEQHAFLWTQSGGMVDLNVFLPEGSSWVLQVAHDINDAGWIAGWGVNTDDPEDALHAFVLIPEGSPIPAVSEWGLIVMSLLVLTAGTLVLARRRPIHA